MKVLKQVIKKLPWLADDICWLLYAIPFNKSKKTSKRVFTIGVVTFKDRFETCLKPLLRRLTLLFPECQIIVIANGHFRQEEQQKYLAEIDKYCRKFDNVILDGFSEPKGLSYLWNLIIKRALSPDILILNDDLNLSIRFRNFILDSGILDKQIATINHSWSHFHISNSVILSVGLFDERMSELGGEDDDYLARLALHNIHADDFLTNTITRKKSRSKRASSLNSYGKDMSQEVGGYSTLNTNYLFDKWETSDKYFDGAVEVLGRNRRYWKLRSLHTEGKTSRSDNNGKPEE